MNLNELKITLAEESHIPYLKNIWKVCFGDSDEYIDFFFDNRFKTCFAVTVLHNNLPIAGVYLLPVKAYEYGVLKSGFYVYAVGILPQYRGKGIYAYIHSKIYDYIAGKNMFMILCPANGQLCEFYKSLGFMENAYVNEIIHSLNNTDRKYQVCELKVKEYESLRKTYTNDKEPILWDLEALEYALKENKFTGGENLLIEYNGRKIFALVRKNQSFLTITESNAESGARQDLTDFLCMRFNTDKAKWITADKGIGNKILYGLSCNLKRDNYYLNLILN